MVAVFGLPQRLEPEANSFLHYLKIHVIMRHKIALIFISIFFITSFKPDSSYQIGLLKYGGGGDWYANQATSLPNLIQFCNEQLKTNINPEQAVVEVGSPNIYNYPFLHMTGHGNVIFSPQEVDNLRRYLISGGFLHI